MTDDIADRRQRVVVLGASPKPERYSNRAVRLLVDHGHEVIPVHPSAPTIEGLPAVAGLEHVNGAVDTITVYVSAAKSASLGPTVVGLAPGRVIFNPGAENPELQAVLEREGIVVVNACTLVMLNTGQF